jgi:hypothetical protein
MASVNDWATKAAQHIHDELPRIRNRPRVDRIAAIIATYAEPLIVLLTESKREHEEMCANQRIVFTGICHCGADAWNARVDAVLAGTEPPG